MNYDAYVASTLFGANFLFDRDRLGVEGTFDDVARLAGVTGVRYPGGTISEEYFDIENPDRDVVESADRTKRSVTPLSTFFTWSQQEELDVSIVIPTKPLLEGGAGNKQPRAEAYDKVYKFVFDVLSGEFGKAKVSNFEIGNEYWLGGEQNHEEYRLAAEIVAVATQDAINNYILTQSPAKTWREPDISIQIGQYGRHSRTPGFEQNDFLRDELSDEAWSAVDGVIAHYYTRGSYDDLTAFQYFFDRLNQWSDRDGGNALNYHISEWNVDYLLSTETGLGQAASMIWMLSEMAIQGVDSAHVWPVQQNTRNDLSGDEGSSLLTPAGVAFSLMSSLLPDTILRERSSNAFGTKWMFAKEEGIILIFAATDTDWLEESFPIPGMGAGAQITKWLLSATDDPLSPKSQAILSISVASGISSVEIDIRRNEILFVEVVGSPALSARPLEVDESGPIFLSDQSDTFEFTSNDPAEISGAKGADYILGGRAADTIRGDSGNDTLGGSKGADSIMGGRGDDQLSGGQGNDRLEGGGGRDKIIGGSGNDELTGGAWDDTLFGEAGDDAIFGGDGKDSIEGGCGRDSLEGGDFHDTVGGGGHADTLSGGRGDDILDGGSGNDLIYGGPGNDIIFGGGGNDTIYGGGGNDTIYGGEGNDIVYSDEGAGFIYGGESSDALSSNFYDFF